MPKSDRLQLRMNPRLKAWFEKFARRRGGMSQLVHGHVEDLYTRETGEAWVNEDDNGKPGAENEARAGSRGTGDPEPDGQRPI